MSDPIAITGVGTCVGDFQENPVDLNPWLRAKKMRKFMGKQDQLAVAAAGKAAFNAGYAGDALGQRTGLYLSVGYIPFERADIEPIARYSSNQGRFSMERFSTEGLEQANPLLTFRCLPNMPIFHVSLNLGITGPYFISYPGPGQFYLGLERAISALKRKEIDIALVGGVADQKNFLVERHFRRIPQYAHWTLMDGAGFICLERQTFAQARQAKILFECADIKTSYGSKNLSLGGAHFNLRADRQTYQESCLLDGHEFSLDKPGYLGPASLPYYLMEINQTKPLIDARQAAAASTRQKTGIQAAGSLLLGAATVLDEERREMTHTLQALDGISAQSRWRVIV